MEASVVVTKQMRARPRRAAVISRRQGIVAERAANARSVRRPVRRLLMRPMGFDSGNQTSGGGRRDMAAGLIETGCSSLSTLAALPAGCAAEVVDPVVSACFVTSAWSALGAERCACLAVEQDECRPQAPGRGDDKSFTHLVADWSDDEDEDDDYYDPYEEDDDDDDDDGDDDYFPEDDEDDEDEEFDDPDDDDEDYEDFDEEDD